MSEKINVTVDCKDCAFCTDDGLGCKILNDVPMVCENYLDKDLKNAGLPDDDDLED